jgi:hypothetical protein
VWFVNAEQDAPVRINGGHSDIYSVVCDPKGKYVLTFARSGKILVWSTLTWDVLHVIFDDTKVRI